ncbi:MAG TPA: hypothetical protein VHH10_10330 [Rubrobacteraceae bacterium]|jgi:hypothetical protein|nr:hypothetical protein [Rubrobacteraceae bacterium]
MRPPEPRRYPLLGLVAYALVPGERRAAAMRHFRRAGVEALKGVGSLALPVSRPQDETAQRENIELD